jgi:hypothetical protein
MINDLRIVENVELLYNKRVVLYGAGLEGKKILFMMRQANMRVDYFCDSNRVKWGTFYEAVEIISPEELGILSRMEEEIVIIITLSANDKIEQIIDVLANNNVKTENICTKFGFEISFYQNLNELRTDDDTLCYYKSFHKLLQLSMIYQRGCNQVLNMRNEGQVDVLTYQPGKVGSSSIHSSLLLSGVRSFHVHFLVSRDQGIQEINEVATSFGRRIVNRVRKIITIVREPLSREISQLFQRLEQWKVAVISSDYSFLDLCVNMIMGEMRHIYKTQIDEFEWFDNELKCSSGIDVYAHPFDREKGYSIIRNDNVEVLVLKLEKLNNLERVIGDFVGVPDFKLINHNMAENKPSKYLYQNVREAIKIPQNLVDRYYVGNSRMDHFYTEEEKVAFLKKWEKNII